MEFGKPLTDEELNQVLREEARKEGKVFVPIEQIRKEKAERERAASVHKPKTKWQELTEERMINKVMDMHLHWFLLYPLIFWYLTKNEMYHAIRLHNWTLTDGAFMSGFKYVMIIAGITFALIMIGFIGGLFVGIRECIRQKASLKQSLTAIGLGIIGSLDGFIPAIKYPAWYIVAFVFLKHAVLPISEWQMKNPDALDILFKIGMVLVAIHVATGVIVMIKKMKKPV